MSRHVYLTHGQGANIINDTPVRLHWECASHGKQVSSCLKASTCYTKFDKGLKNHFLNWEHEKQQVLMWIGVVRNLAFGILLCITFIECRLKVIFPMDIKIVWMNSALKPILDWNREGTRKSNILSHKACSLELVAHATTWVSNSFTKQFQQKQNPLW